MSWGDILTKVAIGAGGLVIGAIAKGVFDGKDEEKAKDEGRAEAKAEVKVAMDKLEKKLCHSLNSLKSQNEHFQAIIALEAVGVACAACDGDFSDNERKEIGEFVKGMMAQSIPENIKEKIQSIYDEPPTVQEAFFLAKKSGIELEVYEDIIQFVMEIDGVKPEEEEFTHAWSQLKEAA